MLTPEQISLLNDVNIAKLIRLSSYGLLQVTGADAQTFLQGQLTIDVTQLTNAQMQLAAYCNLQGRVLSLFVIYQLNGSFYLLLEKKCMEKTINTLKKYAVFSKVELNDVSDSFELSVLIDVQAELNGLTNSSVLDFPHLSNAKIVLGENKFEMTDATILPESAWDYLLIKNKIPSVFAQSQEQFLPQPLGLEALNAVSFNKGCYLGQEVIARMHFRGKAKQQLVQANIHSKQKIIPGESLFAENRKIIEVVNYVQVEEAKYFTLCIASIAMDENKKTYLLESGESLEFELLG